MSLDEIQCASEIGCNPMLFPELHHLPIILLVVAIGLPFVFWLTRDDEECRTDRLVDE